MTHAQFRIELANNLLCAAGIDTEAASSPRGPYIQLLHSSACLSECYSQPPSASLLLIMHSNMIFV